MKNNPIQPLIERQDVFIDRIKDELEVFLRDDLRKDGVSLDGVVGFDSVYALWFFTGHTERTIDRLNDRLLYLHRQLSKWCTVESDQNPNIHQTCIVFHVRRFENHFQIYNVPDVVWPIDLPL